MKAGQRTVATLRQLADRMNALANRIDDRVHEARARYALAIVKELIARTPVDTSEALSNWRVGTGASAAIPALYAGSGGSTRGASASAAIAAAEAAIEANKSAAVLVIFNAAGHIRYLNEGSSRQAPAGFIEKAILAGRLAARQG